MRSSRAAAARDLVGHRHRPGTTGGATPAPDRPDRPPGHDRARPMRAGARLSTLYAYRDKTPTIGAGALLFDSAPRRSGGYIPHSTRNDEVGLATPSCSCEPRSATYRQRVTMPYPACIDEDLSLLDPM